MKRIIYTIILLSIFTNIKAGDDITVTLFTSGQGQTQDLAKQNALRNAIEQAFGAFISSRTEIVNDKLIKDEIISVSNGNIQKFDIISESALPGNLGYTVTIKSIVSVTKLTSFCESKGMQVEIKGALFAFNVIQKELSASNEKKILDELVLMTKNIAPKMFNYEIKAFEPVSNNNSFDFYYLPVKVSIRINSNWKVLHDLIEIYLENLSIKKNELNDYNRLSIRVYEKHVISPKNLIIGQYKFYKRSEKPGGNQEEFDLQELGISKKNTNYDIAVLAKEFKQMKYKSSIYKFRTNLINDVLLKIQSIIESEVMNYKLFSESDLLFSGSEGNTYLYSPVINVDDQWGSKYERFNKNIKRFRLWGDAWSDKTEHVVTDNTVFFNDFDNNALIGFAYDKIPLDIKKIKNLKIISIRHE